MFLGGGVNKLLAQVTSFICDTRKHGECWDEKSVVLLIKINYALCWGLIDESVC